MKHRLLLSSLILILVSCLASAQSTRKVPSEYGSIQEAVDACIDGDTVEVEDGIFKELNSPTPGQINNVNINIGSKSIMICSKNGSGATTINLEHGAIAFQASGGTIFIDGFRIENGNDGGLGGGAIRIVGGAMWISNCVFVSNSAVGANSQGGSAFVGGFGSLNFEGCSFITNSAGSQGGAVYSDSLSSLFLSSCVLVGNTAGGSGGAVYSDNQAQFEGCLFEGNSASAGGAVYGLSSVQAITCVFSSNSATSGPGGALAFNNVSIGELINCTVVGNTATGPGAALYLDSSSSAFIGNSIFWDNESSGGISGSGSVDVVYSNIQGGASGTGNINADPRFVSGTFRLRSTSPCIDAGDTDTWSFKSLGLQTDVDGTPRVLGASIDMGAYEFVSTLALTDAIKKKLDDLVSNGEMLPAFGKPLKVNVNRAVARIHAGDIAGAEAYLQAFIDQVEAGILLGQVSSDVGQELIDDANYVISLL